MWHLRYKISSICRDVSLWPLVEIPIKSIWYFQLSAGIWDDGILWRILLGVSSLKVPSKFSWLCKIQCKYCRATCYQSWAWLRHRLDWTSRHHHHYFHQHRTQNIKQSVVRTKTQDNIKTRRYFLLANCRNDPISPFLYSIIARLTEKWQTLTRLRRNLKRSSEYS